MTVEAIKAAIEQLEEQAWDAEMQQDLSPGGRGHRLVEKINQEIDEGKFTPLEEGLRSRREQP
jgi:hypothetical protein